MPSPSSGPVTVNGNEVPVYITINPVYLTIKYETFGVIFKITGFGEYPFYWSVNVYAHNGTLYTSGIIPFGNLYPSSWTFILPDGDTHLVS